MKNNENEMILKEEMKWKVVMMRRNERNDVKMMKKEK